LLGANAWLDHPLTDGEILNIAAKLDGHADNVAASLLGGLRVACWDGDRVFTLPVQCTDDIHIVLAVPRKRVATQHARTILPDRVPMSDAVFNVGRVALLVAAFASLDYTFIGAGMEDRLHQTYRQELMPEMPHVIAAAKEAGAWGAALSGSGPTIAAYCIGRAEEVGEAMKMTFSRARIDATIHITTIDFRGASTSLPD
jgi:homoserine kinase